MSDQASQEEELLFRAQAKGLLPDDDLHPGPLRGWELLEEGIQLAGEELVGDEGKEFGEGGA